MEAPGLRRLMREFQQYQTDPVPGIMFWPADGSNLFELEAIIEGAPDTPYEGSQGTFILASEKKAQFVTKVYHPNIDPAGRICLDILKAGWSANMNIRTLLLSLQSLLSHPNPDDGLVREISMEYLSHYSQYATKAKEFTRLYAQPDVIHPDVIQPSVQQRAESNLPDALPRPGPSTSPLGSPRPVQSSSPSLASSTFSLDPLSPVPSPPKRETIITVVSFDFTSPEMTFGDAADIAAYKIAARATASMMERDEVSDGIEIISLKRGSDQGEESVYDRILVRPHSSSGQKNLGIESLYS